MVGAGGNLLHSFSALLTACVLCLSHAFALCLLYMYAAPALYSSGDTLCVTEAGRVSLLPASLLHACHHFRHCLCVEGSRHDDSET